MSNSQDYWSKKVDTRPKVRTLTIEERRASVTFDKFQQMNNADKVEFFLPNMEYSTMPKKDLQDVAMDHCIDVLSDCITRQELKVIKVIAEAKKKWQKEEKESFLEDSEDDSYQSDGGLTPILPYSRSTYKHEDLLPFLKKMKQFISTFSSLAQLGGLLMNGKEVYMCPCGGNDIVAPLWKWFPYDVHFDDLHSFGKLTKTTCSGKKGKIFKTKAGFLKHLTTADDIRHNLLRCYIKRIDGKLSFNFPVPS